MLATLPGPFLFTAAHCFYQARGSYSDLAAGTFARAHAGTGAQNTDRRPKYRTAPKIPTGDEKDCSLISPRLPVGV